MLSGAGLLLRSLVQLQRLQLGYRADHLSIISVAYSKDVDSPDKMFAWGDETVQRLRALPSVTSVTPILMPPFQGANIWLLPFEAEGQAASLPAGTTSDVPIELGGAEYFQTFGVTPTSGRGFSDGDREGTVPVAVISQSLAQRFWPGQSAIGKRIRYGSSSAAPGVTVPAALFVWRTVVGVVPDTRYRTFRESSGLIYLPWRQFTGWQGTFAIRSSNDMATLAAPIRAAVHQVNPTLTVWSAHSMDDLLGEPLAQPRLSAMLLTGFAMIALTLAAIGLYGAMSAVVRERTREIGIRMALGATPAHIRVRVLREALIVATVGGGLGLGVSLMVTRLLRAVLFDVSPSDPLTMVGVCIFLLMVAAIAAYLPARRATQVDVVQALRAD
jgi:predicted permease